MTEVTRIVGRYNQGCAALRRAVSAWRSGDFATYEEALGLATRELGGALEWAMKAHIGSRRSYLADVGYELPRRPSFADLVSALKVAGDPVLSEETADSLFQIRDSLRNPSEHQGAVPSNEDVRRAVEYVAGFINVYVPAAAAGLVHVDDLFLQSPATHAMLGTYLEAVRRQFEYMDLGGISPRVGSRVVRIPMRDLFVPLDAIDESSLPADLDLPGVEFPTAPEASAISVKRDGSPRRHRVLGPVARVADIAGRPRVVLLGDPGSGKTTVGRHIAYSLAAAYSDPNSESGTVPIVIRAAEYASRTNNGSDSSLFEYVVRACSDRFGELFEWAIINDRALLIIDGLDEVPEPASRVTVARRIEQLATEFPGCRLLVSSRLVGYRNNRLVGDFEHFVLSELSDKAILDFLQQWHRAVDHESQSGSHPAEAKARAGELHAAIESSRGVRKLAGNPLLLTIIALANWRGTKLPNRRVELYEIATETLVENWPLKQRGLTLDADEILRMLEPVAHFAVNSGTHALISETDLRPMFERRVGEVRGLSEPDARSFAREMLRVIEEHTGFFVEKGLDETHRRVYGFLHLTFAEYLTARHFAELWSSDKLDLGVTVHDPKWHEVVLLMAGRVGGWATAQGSRLVSQIAELNSAHEDVLRRDLLMAGEVLGDNVRVNRETFDSVARSLIQLAVTTPYHQLEAAAHRQLAAISRVVPIPQALDWARAVSSRTARKGRPDAAAAAAGNRDPSVLRAALDYVVGDDVLGAGAVGLMSIFEARSSGTRGPTLILRGPRVWMSVRPDSLVASSLLEAGLPMVTVSSLIAGRVPRNGPIFFDLSSATVKDAESLAQAIAAGHLGDSYTELPGALPGPVTRPLIRRLVTAAVQSPGRPADRAMQAVEWLADDVAGSTGMPMLEPAVLRDLGLIATGGYSDASKVRAVQLISANLPSKIALQGLLSVLADGPESARREAAEWATIARRLPRALVEALRNVALGDHHPTSKAAAARALIGATPGMESSDLLRIGFESAPVPKDGWDAERWLRDLIQLQPVGVTDEFDRRRARQVDRWLLSSRSSPFMPGSFRVGGSRPGTTVPPRMKAQAELRLLHRRAGVRLRAVNLWSVWREESDTPAIRPMLDDSDPRVRSAAIGALQAADAVDPVVIDKLLALLDSDVDSDRTASSRALPDLVPASDRDRVLEHVANRLRGGSSDQQLFAVAWGMVSSSAR